MFFTGIEHLDHVLMMDLGRGLALAQEALAHGALGVPAEQHLDRDLAREALVPSKIDHAHRALT